MKRQYLCSCVHPDPDIQDYMTDIIDNAIEISMDIFLDNCEVEPELLRTMIEYSDDFMFYQSGEIFYYEHSAIEYFYR